MAIWNNQDAKRRQMQGRGQNVNKNQSVRIKDDRTR